jgi:hypothetical protein
MGIVSASARMSCALALALLLALRLLSPAGFMPAFERGAVTIVACPDSGAALEPAHHHSADHKNAHQPCPYAAAPALGTLADGWTPALALLAFGVALVLGRSYAFIERNRAGERPHPTGPPFPA